MFETSRRSHPLHTFRFWFVVLAAGVVTFAWKFDLLPVRIGPADTGQLTEEMFTDIDGNAAATSPTDESAAGLPFAVADVAPDLPSVTPRQTAMTEPTPGVPSQSEPVVAAGGQSTSTDESPFAIFGDDWPVRQAPHATTASPTAEDGAQQDADSSIQHAIATSGPLPSTNDGTLAAPSAAPDAARLAPAAPAGIDFAEIDRLIATGLTADEVEAHRLLSTLYWQQPEARPALRERIDTLSQNIYFLGGRHYMEAYQVHPGDMLQDIARKYDVSWQYLAKLNRVDPKQVRSGQRLKVIKGPFSAIIDLSDYELTIHAHGYYVTRYPVGIGKDGSSPIGRFTVQEKLVDPTYYGPDGVIAHDDPANPLGERWIDIGHSYGLHGTIDPSSIGRNESRGCIRLHNDDVAAVFDLLTIGSEVTIRP